MEPLECEILCKLVDGLLRRGLIDAPTRERARRALRAQPMPALFRGAEAGEEVRDGHPGSPR